MKLQKKEKVVSQHTSHSQLLSFTSFRISYPYHSDKPSLTANSKTRGVSGITLVALLVTIVVLLILAGITITLLFGNNGIIKKSQDAKEKTESAMLEEQSGINTLTDQMAQALGEDTSSLAKLMKAGTRVTEKTTVTDKYGNDVVIPAGFKIAEDSGTTVKAGIVIEDNDITDEDIANGITRGNQFVWIPVSGTGEEGETTIPIKINETTETTIILGRYTFDTSTGAETLIQKGAEYAITTLAAASEDENSVIAYRIGDYYYELNEQRESVQSFEGGTNTTAKDIGAFIESVKENHGYYIARYEASYGSGYNAEGGETVAEQIANAKPLSKVSTANSEESMSYERGTLWNYITQGNAATVARNMYAGNKDEKGNSVGVESDLVNSYAWDTAIVYIQAMGNTNYANQRDGNGTLKNTGETGDVVCNIYDMAANEVELTTEYSTHGITTYAYPCVIRGGFYGYIITYTAARNYIHAENDTYMISFRSTLYVQ